MSSVGVPPITFDLRDLTTEQGLIKFNDHVNKMVTAINTLFGLHGPVPIQNSINMGGNTIQNLGAPVNPTDALHQQAATQQFGPAVIQAQMEVTGNNMLQTFRMLNNQVQREQYSSFLNDVLNLPPTSNTSTITSVAAGANSTVTVAAGTYSWGDGSSVKYAQRIDTFANPGAGSNYYYYYLRKSDSTVQFSGPFTANTSANQLNASLDGRGFIGTAQVTAAGGGTAGGGGDPPAQGGCLEIGTPLTIPQGKRWSVVIEPCNDWIVIHFADGRKIVAARDTQIAVLKKVQDLDSEDVLVMESGKADSPERIEEDRHPSYRMKMTVEGRMYYGAGVMFANWKPLA